MSGQLLEDPVWQELLRTSAVSTKSFASTFMPETFFRPFSEQSKILFDAIDSSDKQVLIIAHRGFGKTTNTMAAALKRICFKQNKFIVMASETATSAELNARNLQAEITSNSLINTVFGKLKSDESWSVKQFVAGETFVLPRGAGQQIRGLKYGNQRPDLILVDDLEDSEAVMSEDQRNKLEDWFFSDLLNCVDRGADNWKVVVVGTILHESALLSKLRKDPAWKVIEIPLCDDNLSSLYPEFMSDKQVRELYENWQRQGKADVFAREYQNKPISGLDAVFKQEYWKDNYYEPSELLDNKEVFFVTIMDPAKTANLSSNDSAIITAGVDLQAHKIYFHDCVRGKLHPDQLLDEFFDQIVRHKSRIGAFEVTSLHEFISGPVYSEARKRGVHCKFVELLARGKKELRIAQLAPFYRQRYVYHNKNVSAPLELQLMDFPRAALDDVSDAFAYIIEVMELNEDYFYAPEVPDQDEYSELENDKPFSQPWRCA